MAAKPGKAPRTRQEQFEIDEKKGEDRPALDLPPAGPGEHLVDYLFRVGPSAGGEMLTFQELTAWSEATGVVLDAWEAETLRLLSGAYLAEHDAAKDAERQPPSGVRSLAQAAAAEALVLKMMSQYEAAPGQGQPEGPKVNRRASVIRKVPAQSARAPDAPASPEPDR